MTEMNFSSILNTGSVCLQPGSQTNSSEKCTAPRYMETEKHISNATAMNIIQGACWYRVLIHRKRWLLSVTR